jgi:hypothetical protein
MRLVGHAACMCKMRNLYNIFIGKSEGKRALERPRYGQEDNIKMDLKEIR